jgi:DNA modification methylase
MAEMPAKSVHCVVTSPPYWGLRDYKVHGQIGLEATIQEYVGNLVEVFREVWDLLCNDGTVWLNLGDSYSHGGNGSRDSERWPKQSRNDHKIEHSKKQTSLKPKDLCGVPWRVAFALQADGWYLRQDIIWSKPNPMPESVTDRCTKAHEYLFLLSKSERYYYDAEAIKEAADTDDLRRPYGSPGANLLDAREHPQGQGKPRKIKMPDGWDTGPGGHGSFHREGREKGKTRIVDSTNGSHVPGATPHGGIHRAGTEREPLTRNKRSVWTIAPKPFKEAHFATFPPALIEPCILAGCPIGGTVLDPFGGAGTTGLVAKHLGRKAILIELNPDYVKMSRNRVK